MGQRKGLGVGGLKKGSGAAWYVLKKDTVKNQLVLTQNKKDPELYRKIFEVNQMNWISPVPELVCACEVRIRHQQSLQPCIIKKIAPDCVRVECEQPLRAVTPGQAAVFYKENWVLGGGTIA